MGSKANSKLLMIFLATAMLALSGCASMSSEQCALMDWSAIGYTDGSNGYTSDRFSQHSKACAKHGYAADFQAYQTGRAEGLVEFCQPSRGYNLGLNGRKYAGVCDAALEDDFLDAYRVGQQLYSLRSNVNNANSRIHAKERELERLNGDMRANEALLISDETTTEERVLLLAELKDMSERIGELEVEIDMLISDRAHYEHELANYESTVAAYGF